MTTTHSRGARATLAIGLSGLAAFLLWTGVLAEVNAITPSTNDTNRDNGWAHVNQTEVGVGTTTLEFVSTRSFYSCFEYRTDGDTSQASGAPNFNLGVLDGLYPYRCVNNSTSTLEIDAQEYVEVRMVFGAETDERFDWTRFDVISKNSCMDGGWEALGFSNQGRCIQFVNTGTDSR
jgi:hypothetical protein